MGKSRDRGSLIRKIVNIAVHEIIAKHTNKPESVHFLNSEIIEYRSQAIKKAEKYNWDEEDREYTEKKASELAKEKLNSKYKDVKHSEEELTKTLKEIIKEVMHKEKEY